MATSRMPAKGCCLDQGVSDGAGVDQVYRALDDGFEFDPQVWDVA
jgi:hypothetical protein